MQVGQTMPFRLLGDSTVRAVQAVLAQAASRWAADWGVACAQVDVGVQRAWDASGAQTPVWTRRARAGLRQVWLVAGADFAKGLQQAMFPSAADYLSAGTDSLAPAAADAALAALEEALIGAALPGQQPSAHDAAPVPSACWKRGSGALVAQLALGRRHCHILLDGAAVQALLAAPAALPALPAVDVKTSIATVPVSLRLDAGTARVGLGALLALAPGDVIRLDLDADAPLALGTLAGNPLFEAYLGRSGDGLAVELVRSHTQVGEVQ
jgi:hypothetical protein